MSGIVYSRNEKLYSSEFGWQERDGKKYFCVLSPQDINTERMVIPRRHSQIYFYYLEPPVSLGCVMAYLGFEFNQGLSVLDGTLLKQDDLCKPFLSMIKADSPNHALINLDKECVRV